MEAKKSKRSTKTKAIITTPKKLHYHDNSNNNTKWFVSSSNRTEIRVFTIRNKCSKGIAIARHALKKYNEYFESSCANLVVFFCRLIINFLVRGNRVVGITRKKHQQKTNKQTNGQKTEGEEEEEENYIKAIASDFFTGYHNKK